MPKFLCRCEHVINLSPVPCPQEKFLIDGDDFNAILELMDGNEYQQAVSMLEEKAVSVIVCDTCGRHYLRKDQDSNEYWAFVREE